jgi:hypothetical protein
MNTLNLSYMDPSGLPSFFVSWLDRLRSYIRPMMEACFPPGPHGIRSPPPHQNFGLSRPRQFPGSGSDGLTCYAMITKSPTQSLAGESLL